MLCAALACAVATAGAFGITESENYYTIDTGTELVFQVRRKDLGGTSTSAGDINSILYKGVEYMETLGRGSHINSGFDWLYEDTTEVSVDAETIGDDIIKITVVGGQLTHYYIVKKGESRVYMGTYWSLMSTIKTGYRYLFRLNSNLITNGPPEGDIRDPTNSSLYLPFLESQDIFAVANGESRAKHYTNHRMMDWKYMGGTSNDNVGMWIIKATHEGGTGGPFYRTTQIQTTPTTMELTYILNYNHANPEEEDWRVGNLYQYTFIVNDGSAPETDIDYTFYKDLNLVGFVGPEGRGQVACSSIEGKAADRQYVAHLRNADSQYWATADDASGSFTVKDAKPGVYTLTVYRVEFEVYTKTNVVVKAGETTDLGKIVANSDANDRESVWRIGEWDGTPQELRNGLKVTTMHPSDVRMEPWESADFVVGTDPPTNFPCYMWKDVNNYRSIKFELTPAQMTQRLIVRIGTTTSYNAARPNIIINYWQADALPVKPYPSTRSLTTGSYRHINAMYEYEVPTAAWDATEAMQTLIVICYSTNSNSGYLSPGMSVDAIDLVRFVEPTAAPDTVVPTAAPATSAPTASPPTAAPATAPPPTAAATLTPLEPTPAPEVPTPEPATASPSTDAAAAAAAPFSAAAAALLVAVAVALVQ
ncbi:Rhamnogalacturonate lyase A [Diplonema papillatum]|nr:Rhamnogalacturonate lyase A [Diplonema papillatum]